MSGLTMFGSAAPQDNVRLQRCCCRDERAHRTRAPDPQAEVHFINMAPRKQTHEPEQARLWNAQSGQLTAALTGHTGEVLTGSFSPDGARVVTSAQDKTVRVRDAMTGKQQIAFGEHKTSISAAFFFPDNSRVVSIGSEGKAMVWNASTGEAPRLFVDQAIHCLSRAVG